MNSNNCNQNLQAGGNVVIDLKIKPKSRVFGHSFHSVLLSPVILCHFGARKSKMAHSHYLQFGYEVSAQKIVKFTQRE